MLQRYGKVCNKALHEQMAKLNGRTVPTAEARVSYEHRERSRQEI